ncbi:MAG: hypothetical protein EOO13_11725 [Chitinophagaceae bacterium]|nr:MAG: hypothetical protein EOO13_11725 [Chitinophagaceae bacterium]
MDTTTPFDVQYLHNGVIESARIHPCCKEDNIVDYAIWQGEKMLFTMTRDMVDRHHWSIAIKNADDDFEDELIQNIGAAIEHHQS